MNPLTNVILCVLSIPLLFGVLVVVVACGFCIATIFAVMPSGIISLIFNLDFKNTLIVFSFALTPMIIFASLKDDL